MKGNEKKQILGHVIACATQMMWGSTFIASKVLLQYFLPVEILFIRVLLALVVMFIVYPHRLRIKDIKKEVPFALAALFGIVLYFMFENTALTYTYASNVGIIVACAPFFIAVIIGLIFKSESLKWNFFVGFVISIAGIVMISMNGQTSLGLNPIGDILAVIAMVSWGCYSAIIKKLEVNNYPVIPLTRRIYCYAAVFLIPVCLAQHATFNVSAFKEPVVIGNLLFLGIIGSAVGFLLWNWATRLIGAIKTSVYLYVSPIVTVVMSALILGEKLTVVSVAGIILIFAGLLLSQKTEAKKTEIA